jgi:hypothetical protein
VTQEQHDEWREWLVQTIMKHYRMKRKVAERNMGLIYLNTSPMVR